MARTATMRLLELMVLKEDISKVIEYIGKKKCFQFDTEFDDYTSSISNQQKDIFDKLQLVRNFLDIEDVEDFGDDFSLPTEQDVSRASQIISAVEDLRKRETDAAEEKKRLEDAYKEALSFANLKVPTSLGVKIMEKQSTIPNDVIGGSFKEAFVNARKSGLDVFEWNGKKYSTRVSDSRPYIENAIDAMGLYGDQSRPYWEVAAIGLSKK